jgi:stage V sporulation protein D (sporulation-specific penicillin-binding protein)
MGVIVMNPNNGEVLAMAGKLTYDLNNPRDLSAYYSEEELSKMRSEDKLKALNVIWRNYCISDTYEPGSTAKPFTVASALDENIIAEDDVFECNGYEVVGGWRIKCHKHAGHGIININQAIALSCNDAMMHIAAKEGAKIFSSYQKVFNFGSKTKIDLPGEESCEKLIYNAEDMKPADLATNSFGQNFNVTMIQMASAFSALVNGGYYYTPHVVKEIVNENGGVIMSANDSLSKQTITKNTADIITAGLKTCVDTGTGKAAAMPGYNVGGKTGTAEKYPRGNNEYVISFIGYVGVEKPEYVCYVVIDNPKMEKVSTSYASKLFKAIMYEVVSYEGVFPEDENTEEESTSKVEQPTTGNSGSTEQTTPGGTSQEQETTTATEDEGEIFEEGIFEDTGTEEGGVTEPSGDEIN